jgi:hypothetical protein
MNVFLCTLKRRIVKDTKIWRSDAKASDRRIRGRVPKRGDMPVMKEEKGLKR